MTQPGTENKKKATRKKGIARVELEFAARRLIRPRTAVLHLSLPAITLAH